MTSGDWTFVWALIFGLGLNAIAVYLGIRGNRKQVKSYHDQVNGRMDQLLREVRTGSIAEGRKLESDERNHKC